jgi:hypothetical protein
MKFVLICGLILFVAGEFRFYLGFAGIYDSKTYICRRDNQKALWICSLRKSR